MSLKSLESVVSTDVHGKKKSIIYRDTVIIMLKIPALLVGLAYH